MCNKWRGYFAHKLQYFSTTLQGKNANWFTCYETTNLVATWGEV
jgi:hypothetical protein